MTISLTDATCRQGRRQPRSGWGVVLITMTALLVSACGSDADDGAAFSGARRDPQPMVGHAALPSATENGSEHAFSADPGNLMLVFFGYTHCPDVCPTTMADVAAVKKMLDEDGDRIEVAMVTVDPDRDTPEILENYVTGFIPDGLALRTDDPEQLAAAASEFGVFYEVTTTDDGRIDVAHTGTIFGINDEGALVAEWIFGTPRSDLHHDLTVLLEEAAA